MVVGTLERLRCKMSKDDALKMAIEFMETLTIDVGIKIWNEKHRKEAIKACKEALEQPTTQEPVASRFKLSDGNYSLHNDQYDFGEPLYTHPPKQWQWLSDYEITSLEYDHVSYETFDEGEYGTEINIYTKEFARAIEAKLKEKNT